MFDIGFLELVVILVLSLLVLGPERLPKAAKTVGYWFGKARRYVEGMKAQVESEFDTTDVKRLLRNQEVQIRELQGKIQDTANVNHFIDDDDPGNEHQEINEADEENKPAGPQYEMIEEDDERWDDLEESNPSESNPSKSNSSEIDPSEISAEENNEIDENKETLTDIKSNAVDAETSKAQSESVK